MYYTILLILYLKVSIEEALLELQLRPRAVEKELRGVGRTVLVSYCYRHETGRAHVWPNRVMLSKFSD